MTARLVLGLAVSACCGSAQAEPGDYVATPQVTAGERELDFKAGAARQADGSALEALSAGLGYGVNDLWFTEIYLKYQRASPASARFDAVEWENKLQLTEPGQYLADFGLLLEAEMPRDRDEGFPVSLALLLQADVARWQFNGNLALQRSFRNALPQDTILAYQWQVEYRWRPEFQYGLQGFGELGTWDEWSSRSAQSHRLGPAVFGKWALGGRQAIRYNAAWLIGATPGAPTHTARLQVEYEY